MAIFLNEDSKVIVQGMTGSEGAQAHPADARVRARRSSAASRPARAGRPSSSTAPRMPVFGTVGEAVEETGADVVGRLRPAEVRQGRRRRGRRRRDPARRRHHRGRPGARHRRVLPVRAGLGHDPDHRPELPGADQPRQVERRHHPGQHHPARAASAWSSKSGTLTYQMMYELRDIGFSTAVGIGGDPVIGTTHIDCLAAFQDDPETEAIVMIGEIGGDAEERAAAYITEQRDQAGRRLRRRVHRARGQDDGPRRRDRVRLVRHRRRPRRRPSRRPASGRQDAERDRAADARDRRLPLTAALSGRRGAGGIPPEALCTESPCDSVHSGRRRVRSPSCPGVQGAGS